MSINTHKTRMSELIANTRKDGEEPYGCSIYDDNNQKIVEVFGNENSPINHAEILAINECAKKFPEIKWHTLMLYTTGEPCCMCAAACCWANLKTVVYATNVLFMIELWGLESPIRASDIINSYPKKPELIADVCQDEANQMFLAFREDFAKLWQEKRWVLEL